MKPTRILAYHCVCGLASHSCVCYLLVSLQSYSITDKLTEKLMKTHGGFGPLIFFLIYIIFSMQLLFAAIFEHRLMQSIECVGATLSLSHIRQPDRHASGSIGHRTGRLCHDLRTCKLKCTFYRKYSNAVLRIRDVYPGSWIKNIHDPDPHKII
jgi:hypothetical protein